jgi:hypothetical protein
LPPHLHWDCRNGTLKPHFSHVHCVSGRSPMHAPLQLS